MVLLQVTRLTKSFITPATLVPVVACVNGDDVRPHVRLTREPGRMGAAVRPFPRVGPCVYGELPPCNEAGRAYLAPVGLHSIVKLHISCVIKQVAKRGDALLTLADLLSGMYTFVSRQFTRLYEPLPTDITHEQSLAKVNTFRLLS